MNRRSVQGGSARGVRRAAHRTGSEAARTCVRLRSVVVLLLRNSRLVLVVQTAAAAILIVTMLVLSDPGALFPDDVLARAADSYDGSSRRISASACGVVVLVAAAAVAAAGRTFRQAVRLGFARSEVLLGTALYAVILALATGGVLTAVRAVERATTGFGVRMLLFDVPLLGPTLLGTPLRAAALVFAFTAIGLGAAAVRRRTGSVLAAGAVVVVGFVVAITVAYAGVVVVMGWLVPWPDGHIMIDLLLAGVAVLVVPSACAWVLLLRRAPVD